MKKAYTFSYRVHSAIYETRKYVIRYFKKQNNKIVYSDIARAFWLAMMQDMEFRRIAVRHIRKYLPKKRK